MSQKKKNVGIHIPGLSNMPNIDDIDKNVVKNVDKINIDESSQIEMDMSIKTKSISKRVNVQLTEENYLKLSRYCKKYHCKIGSKLSEIGNKAVEDLQF